MGHRTLRLQNSRIGPYAWLLTARRLRERELEVAKEDIGKVIGRKGIHADAIRRIVHAAGGKHKMRYVLEIIEER